MKKENLSKRYFFKLISSVIVILLNIVLQMALPRIMTMEEYGFVSYNLNIFTSILTIANLSTSNAVCVKIAHRNNDRGILTFYFKFLIYINIILIVATLVLYPIFLKDIIFAGQSVLTVLLALEATFMLRFQTDVVALYDSFAIAKEQAYAQVILKTLICIAVLIGYVTGIFNLLYFYLCQFVIIGIVMYLLVFKLLKYQISIYEFLIYNNTLFYLKEFYTFCKPLFISQMICQGTMFLMNWALMHWGGVYQQALFSAAWQFNILLAAFFEPYVALLRREFATDVDRSVLNEKYNGATIYMGIILGYFTMYIIANNGSIIRLIFGDKYLGIESLVPLVMLYTFFQAYGQILGTFFLSTNKTIINAKISVVSQALLVICIWIFQIPNPLFSNGLGALGISLTYVLSNIVSVNISLFIASQLLKRSYCRDISLQLRIILIFCFFSHISKRIADFFINSYTHYGMILNLIISMFIYSLMLMVIIYIFPGTVNTTRENIKILVIRIRQKWRFVI